MLPLVVLIVFSFLSKNSAEQWPINDYNFDTDSAEVADINYLNNINNYDNNNYDDYDVWDQIEHDIQLLEDTDDSLKTRGIPTGHTRRNKLGCVEKWTVHDVPKMSEDEEIYPKRYHNVTCKPATGSHQDSVMMGFCTVVYNPTCETAYRQVPIFTKKHNCWKHTRTIPVEQGCKCRHQ